MKHKYLFVLIPMIATTLSSCGRVINYEEHLDDYVFAMKYHDDFNILQLTDIHWNNNSSTLASKNYLDKLFVEVDKKAKIDLVEITGDQFMLANSYHVRTFIEYFEKKADEYGFKYAVIWGNHDRHGLYNPNWLADQFSHAKNCYYIEHNDNLYGRSNFVINLTDNGEKTGTTIWQIANIDSGASFSETTFSMFKEYDFIRKDQTDWWLKEHVKVGDTVPTIAYYHIPQDENEKAWNEVVNGAPLKNKFFKLERFADTGIEEYASDFIDKAKDHNLKAAFMGHAHNIDWTVEYEGVVIGLGVKTGYELYFAHIDADTTDEYMRKGLESVGIDESFDLVGASLVTLKDANNFDLEHLYFNERVGEDFVKWVKW